MDYPIEFFEDHHKNHVHNDDSDGNVIAICVKCHKRHHVESGYDTIIIKKDFYNPKTLEEEMMDIDREVFLKIYKERQNSIFSNVLKRKGKLNENVVNWIKENANGLFDETYKEGFEFKR